jgi:hypothetical protein
MNEVNENIDGFQAFANEIESLWIQVSTWVGTLFGADQTIGGVIITVVALVVVVASAVIGFLNHVAG